ncbi:AraC family transcriptional regulator [Acutalibacter sp. 1XD8-33]|nr:AraC family transcriptional regulator [Acutalibacter sp. 1XD8-33]
MRYARTLIPATSKSIGDIAVGCSFDSFAYFSKVYKSIYGISPKSTRK